MEYDEYEGRNSGDVNGNGERGASYVNFHARPLIGRARQSMSDLGQSLRFEGRRSMSRRRNSTAQRSERSLETYSFDGSSDEDSYSDGSSWNEESEREEQVTGSVLTVRTFLAIGTVLMTLFTLIGGGYYIHGQMSRALGPGNVGKGSATLSSDKSMAPSMTPSQALNSFPVDYGSTVPSAPPTEPKTDDQFFVTSPTDHGSTAPSGKSMAPSMTPSQALRSFPVDYGSTVPSAPPTEPKTDDLFVVTSPTDHGSTAPSDRPTKSDDQSFTPRPTDHRSTAPSGMPTKSDDQSFAPRPTDDGSSEPTNLESMSPTAAPTIFVMPSYQPSSQPIFAPRPTDDGSSEPTNLESMSPTAAPTIFVMPRFYQPSSQPSISVHPSQSLNPSLHPSYQPSVSFMPTTQRSSTPSLSPAFSPSDHPSNSSTQGPTATPTITPTSVRVQDSYRLSKRFVNEWRGDPGFGKSVHVSRNHYLIGAPEKTRRCMERGSRNKDCIGGVYLFGQPPDNEPPREPGHPPPIDMNAGFAPFISSESSTDIQFGSCVAISEDSSIIAIGAPRYPCPNSEHDDLCGKVEIYDVINGNKIQKREHHLVGQPGDLFGASVDLSDDGNILAVASAIDNEAISSGRLERVDVFSFNSTSQIWSLLGNSVQGGPLMHSPYIKTAISGDGRTMAMVGKGEFGYARVFECFQDSEWLQKGLDVASSEQWDGMVKTGSLSLSSDGSKIGIGIISSMSSMACDSSSRSDCHHDPGSEIDGNVAIFYFVGMDWKQVGSTFHGWTVSLSRNGMVVAVGCTNHNTRDGEVVVRKLNNGDWVQIGSPLRSGGPYGGVENNQLGNVVEISNDSHLVIGGGSNQIFLWKR
eukprot:scaffold9651_cov267-Chaetoceros_neogracile.AAC.8